MTHPLTDEMCQDIYDLTYKADEMMRTAYDLGEDKGSADMAVKVRDWLDDNIGELLLDTESTLSRRYLELLKEEFIESFVEELCPQEDN